MVYFPIVKLNAILAVSNDSFIPQVKVSNNGSYRGKTKYSSVM